MLLLLSCRERAEYYYYLYYISILLRDRTLIGLSETNENRIDSILANCSDNGNIYDSRNISCRCVVRYYIILSILSLSNIIV